MEVYIEYVVIDNLVVDYLLITITRKTLKLEVSKFFALFSSLVGTVAAVCLPVLKMNKGFTFLSKIILAALIVLLSGKFRSAREYIRSYYLFLLYTFLFGGVVYGVFYLVGIDFSAIDFTYNADFSLGVILFIAYAVYFALKRFTAYLYRKRDARPYLRKCVLSIGGKEMTLTGFIDSGNRLYCDKTGYPVILCSPKTAGKLRAERALDGVKSEIMSFYTASGKSYMKIYKLDSLLIYNGERANRIYNVKMGLSSSDFHADGEYDLILSPALI